jgi:ribose/xylose/arabinose/galactoside ABC-type transport system permease subunit
MGRHQHFRGRGHIFGTVLGVLLIHETREFVSWRWERHELNFILLGVLLIVSVLLNSLLSSREHE